MSCSPNGKWGEQLNYGCAGSEHGGGGEKRFVVAFAAILILTMGFWTRNSWTDPRQPERNWEQMRGNDGKFWKGTPDGGAYADIEGAELREYFQYFYDEQGRLSKINTFRPHTNYDDVWVLANEETCQYDARGRIVVRQETQGATEKVYEYTPEGCTKTESDSSHSAGRVSRYDTEGNRIYFRNAVNYRYPHVTVYEYDEKNRLVRKTLEIEGREPYGVPAYVTYTAEYDEENYTSVETEYDRQEEAVYVWHSTYDENWSKTGSVWYATEKIPEGYTPEECVSCYTRGYWKSTAEGRLMEEMKNDPWKDNRNDSEYTACDYDGNGNRILELKVYSAGFAYLYRYVYDSRNRMTEQYNYNMNDVMFWERRLCDGSRLVLQVSEEGSLSLERTARDGALLNRFVYGEEEVKIQLTPEGIVSWQLNPSLILAASESGIGEKESEFDQTGRDDAESGETTCPESVGTQPEAGDIPEATEFFYTVERGDSLWSIAEEFFGDGRRYRDIYRWNRDVIKDNPRRILPGMRLYLELP